MALFGGGGSGMYGKLRNGQSFTIDGQLWTAYVDPLSKQMYYFNNGTGHSQWGDPRPEPGVGPVPQAATRQQQRQASEQQKGQVGVEPAGPPSRLSETHFRIVAGAGLALGAVALLKLLAVIFRPRVERPEDSFFPLGISESMNEETQFAANGAALLGADEAAAMTSDGFLRSDEPASDDEFFLPGSVAARGFATTDLDESWDGREVLSSAELTLDESGLPPTPPGAESEELPYTEEFFLPGSGASRGLTSQDLEVNRTMSTVDVTVSIDDVEKPGPDSEELPYTEEFFLPGSGATRGLTSQDLEVSRTMGTVDSTVSIDDVEKPGPDSEELPYTEEFFLPGSGATRGLTSQDLEVSRTMGTMDSTVSIDDVERPGPDSEELPYTEEFFLPGSGASRGLTSQDLELRRTMDTVDESRDYESEDYESEEDEGQGQLPPPPPAASVSEQERQQDEQQRRLRQLAEADVWASRERQLQQLSGGPKSVEEAAKAAADATQEVENLRRQLDERYQAAVLPGDDEDEEEDEEDGQNFLEERAPDDGPAVIIEETEVSGVEPDLIIEQQVTQLTPQQDGSVIEAQVSQPERRPAPAADDPVALAERLLSASAPVQAAAKDKEEDSTRDSQGGAQVVAPARIESDDDDNFRGADIRLICAARMLPHPQKRKTGGEDAYFISADGRGAIGVADGVGSWVEDGVNPAEFPRQLVANMEMALAEQDWQSEPGGLRDVLHAAHSAATAQGSATVVLAAAGENGIVHVANLGDCGVRVVKDGDCSFASTDMLHDYNTPFQLGKIEEDEVEIETDSPDDAELYEIEVAPGDALVIASDGLFDNLFDEEIANIMDAIVADERDAKAADRAASALAAAAAAKVRDKESRTPWVNAAARAGELPPWQRLRPRGGKVDDITVVVALVNKA